MPPTRLHVVCDHRMVADVLVDRLRREPDGFVVHQARSTDVHLVRVVHGARPDILLVDARTLPTHWSVLAAPLVEALPGLRVVVLADTASADDAVLAARRGAAAWLSAGVTADHVIDVLKVVAAGGTVYSPAVLGDVLRALAGETGATGAAGGPLGALTGRERDVLGCLVEGRRSAEIARELDMAANTVRTHTTRILSKLGVHSRLEAVRVARRHGLGPAGRAAPGRPPR